MTVIAAFARDGHVWMAGDSATNIEGNVIHSAARKVATVAVEGTTKKAAMGFAGDGAIARFARWRNPLPEPEEDLDDWVTGIASAFTDWCNERGIVDEGAPDGSVAFAYDGRLWLLVKHQAIRVPHGYLSKGSGSLIALGALAMAAEHNADPSESVVRAAKIACRFDPYCAEPVDLVAV